MSQRKKHDIARVATGLTNLDTLLCGGLPRGSLTVVAGAPGSGKTILSQEICFHYAKSGNIATYCRERIRRPKRTTNRDRVMSSADVVGASRGALRTPSQRS